jgi:hypothetical protein
VPKSRYSLASKRLRPDDAKYLGKIALQQGPHLFKHFLCASAHLHKPKITIDSVDTEWRVLYEIAECIMRSTHSSIRVWGFSINHICRFPVKTSMASTLTEPHRVSHQDLRR